MTIDRVLLVDASTLVYANHASLGFLQTSKGVPSGMIYGFLRTVRSHATTLKSTEVIIVWDSPGPVIKAEGVTSYKAGRPKPPTGMWENLPRLKEIIGLTWWAQSEAQGYEADDILGSLAFLREATGSRVVILSPDRDLLQCISDRVTVVTTNKAVKAKRGTAILTASAVQEEFGVPPRALALWRSITGDVSDNIHGLKLSKSTQHTVKGILERWSLKRPMDPKDLISSLEMVSVESSIATLALSELNQAQAGLSENFELSRLHRPPQLTISVGAKDPVRLAEVFEQLEFKSLASKISDFTDPPTVSDAE